MTEAEWLECAAPTPMLEFLHGKASDRKLRLFASACCRRIWQLLDDKSRENINLAERFADGLVAEKEMPDPFPFPCGFSSAPSDPINWAKLKAIGSATDAAKLAAALATGRIGLYHPAMKASFYAAGAAAWEVAGAARKSSEAEAWAKAWNTVEADEFKDQVFFLRDIFGNPFRPITLDSSWLTLTVKAVAQKIYDDHSFDQLPLLADELVKSACDNPEILDHCRGLGEHVKGCWVVDLVLGKE